VKLTYTGLSGTPIETQYFTSVICTVPTHFLRFIEVNPPFSYDKFQAIRGLNYDHSTKVFVQYPTRFWDKTIPQQHSTTQTQIKDKGPGPVTSKGTSIGQGGTTSTDLPVFKVVYPSYRQNELCVLLTSYTWTNDAVLMANMNEVELISLVQRNLKLLHGDIVPEPLDVKVQHWQQAYALFFAGQYANDYVPMVQPEHGVYFAGEHLSIHHAWIVGAMYSAADAVGLFMQDTTGSVPDVVKEWAEESPWFDTPVPKSPFLGTTSG